MHYIKTTLFLMCFHSIFLGVQTPQSNYRRPHTRYQTNSQETPNILIIMVDEWRYDPVYENEELRAWADENLKATTFLREHGVNFDHHYCSSTACNPSRATLFTGQYPTLHGVSQTTGAAKSPSDPTMFWLNPYTVPTIGNFLTQGLYTTYYIGKWHISDMNLYNPGTKAFIRSYDAQTGIPDEFLISLYKNANQLEPFGFGNGWIGPEPEGNSVRESGSTAAYGTSGRDVFFADETVALLNKLNDTQGASTQPWCAVCAFTNPHDICLYGDVTKDGPAYNFETDSSLPSIPPAPTANEDLSTKPTAQQSYKDQYPDAFQATTDTEALRQLYKTLQRKVDDEVGRILTALENSKFAKNTIVIFTSDHGSMVGAHGLQQKFFNVYQETVHVPLIFYSPSLLPQGVHIDMVTTHVDILPTLCGLTNIDAQAMTNLFTETYTNSQPLVGRDLSSIILGTASEQDIAALTEPILFLTKDQVFTGAHMTSGAGTEFDYVTQPASIEAVITEIDGTIWKLTKYYQDDSIATPVSCSCSTPVEDTDEIQYEMYDLANDPYEENNLALDENYTDMFNYLLNLLNQQLEEKALTPNTY